MKTVLVIFSNGKELYVNGVSNYEVNSNKNLLKILKNEEYLFLNFNHVAYIGFTDDKT